MGSLAKYGAIAGVGKGMQEAGETKKEDRQFQQQSTAIEERQMRLEEWRNERGIEAETRAATAAQTQATFEADIATDVREDEQKATAAEGVLERESRERIAALGQGARNVPKWMKERFRPLSQAEKNEYGETIKEKMAVFDAKTGIPYILQNGRWELPDTPVKKETASQGSLDRLRASLSESELELFLDHFGWLPVWALAGVHN